MPTISMNFQNLAPNTFDPNNPSTQSSWFSYVRNVYSSNQHGGTVKPPTKTEFMREWNYNIRNNSSYTFTCTGDCLESMKTSLMYNQFPRNRYSNTLVRRQSHINKIKAEAWTRIIAALNMYAAAREAIGERGSNYVDFIGSAGDSGYFVSGWEVRFHNRCVLYIRDSNLIDLIELSRDSDRLCEFWCRIFSLYDSQLYFRRFNHCPNIHTNSESRHTCDSHSSNIRVNTESNPPIVPTVDAPVHDIAQEYFNRTDDDEEDIVLDNQQIANMIINTRNQLPNDIKKIIHETCIALHMSCSVVSE